MLTLVSKFDPVLRSPARRVDWAVPSQVWRDMLDVMRRENGVGLAAPQVGLDWQVAIVQVGKAGRIELVNPILLKASPKIMVMEGCLSLPGEEYRVPRSMEILVGYQDRQRKHRVERFRGLEAQAVQHELDHLAGRLIDTYEPKPTQTPIRSVDLLPNREAVEAVKQPHLPAGQ